MCFGELVIGISLWSIRREGKDADGTVICGCGGEEIPGLGIGLGTVGPILTSDDNGLGPLVPGDIGNAVWAGLEG